MSGDIGKAILIGFLLALAVFVLATGCVVTLFLEHARLGWWPGCIGLILYLVAAIKCARKFLGE